MCNENPPGRNQAPSDQRLDSFLCDRKRGPVAAVEKPEHRESSSDPEPADLDEENVEDVLLKRKVGRGEVGRVERLS